MTDTPIRILLIDDDGIFHMHIQRVLKKMSGDYTMHWESSSDSGLKLILENDFDVCLLDYHIDHVDGIELLEKYRAAGHDAPVIFLTGEENPDIDERALELGASDFLIKDKVNNSSLERSMRYAMHSYSLITQLRIANQRYQKDLDAAAQIQQALLPQHNLCYLDYDFSWRYQPSSAVAGDLIGYFEIDAQRLGMFCIDVSGHGVPAAMFAVQLSRVVAPGVTYTSPEGVKLFPDDFLDPCILLSKLNMMFPISEKNLKYFTILYAVIERSTGYVSFATAGHPAPFVIRNNGSVEEIPCSGVPIGMLPDITYDAYDLLLDHGESLLIYSDGINEAVNADEELYGYERLHACIKKNNQCQVTLCDHIMEEVTEWQDAEFEQDDCSLIFVSRK